MRTLWLIGALLGIGLSAPVPAQLTAQESDAAQQPAPPEATYFPLFTEQMIQHASPEQAERMRETEARNREAFDKRQQALRESEAQTQQQAATPAPAAAPPRSKSKVFKWVDANGRVHFGDAPQGKNAQEVNVGGAARIQGSPPPPPGRSTEGGKRE